MSISQRFFRVFQVLSLQTILLGGSLFFAGVLSLSPAYAANPCYDITGQGKPVLQGGVANSGIVYFDPPLAPAQSYQACAQKVGSVIQLQGWAWDDNLGWISFYCDNTGSNRGASCGNGTITYGVTIDSAGKFSGYAWGDNIGWIRFDNGSFSQVRVETQNSSCQGYVYGYTPPAGKSCQHGVDVNDGKKWTYAWNDNVGWIDFDGMSFPWLTVQQALTDSNIQVSLSPDPSLLKKSAGTPVANGMDQYKLSVKLTGPDGQPLDTSRYNVNMVPVWAQDSVKKNQTDAAVQLFNLDCSQNFNKPNSLGAVNKPCAAADFFSAGPGLYSAAIQSYAPTSNVNGADDNGDGIVDFPYEQFIAPNTMTVPQANNLELSGVKVAILDNQTLTCVYPDSTCTPKLITPAFAGGDDTLKFLPQTEVTTLKSPKGDNALNLTVGPAQPFTVQMSGPGTIDFQAGIQADPTFQGILDFVFDNSGGPGLIWGQDNGLLGNVDKSKTQLLAGVVQNPAKVAPQYAAGLYLWSKVTEPNGIQYYSNKLPRVKGSIAVQPVAVLRGNVYSRGVATTTASVDQIRTIGDISTNILRDQLYKNVTKIIAGAKDPVSHGQYFNGGNTPVRLGSDGKGGFMNLNNPGAITELLPWVQNGVNKGARVYYARGDVYLGSFSQPNVSWQGERTIIVIGGSVYIDRNLYNGPGISPKPKLGLIVLKDLNHPRPQDGNIYISQDVTNLQGVNIFADGSVFSRNSNLAQSVDPQTGEPIFDATGPGSAEEILKTHQLYIEGSIASQNTIGGSLQDPYVLGNGKNLTGGDGNDNKRRARLYDLNYLRYYTGVLKRDANGNALHQDDTPIVSDSDLRILKPGTSIPWSKYEQINKQYGDLFPPMDLGIQGATPAQGLDQHLDLGSVYVYFDPPTANLPGFSSDGGLDLKQLQR